MLYLVIASHEALAALLALVRFDALVQAHVPAQVGFVIELFRAFHALERFVSAMLGDVRGERLGGREALAARFAFKGPGSAMERLVVLR